MGSRWIPAGVLVLCCLFGGAPAAAAAPAGGEYEVKAAFLYNFLQFVRWPEGGGRDYRVCVLGDDPFGAALDLIAGEPVGETGRAVVVRLEGQGAVGDCQLLFVSGSERERLAKVLAATGDRVLTVADWPGFAVAGGMIELYLEGGAVRFAVNRAAVERSRLRLSSQLMGLARIVQPR